MLPECYYMYVTFRIQLTDVNVDHAREELAILPLSWGAQVVMDEAIRTMRTRARGDCWYGIARFPKNSIIRYAIAVVRKGGDRAIKVREGLIRKLRLGEANLRVLLTFNDPLDIQTYEEQDHCPDGPFLLPVTGIVGATRTDPSIPLLTAVTRHVERDSRLMKLRRRLPRSSKSDVNPNPRQAGDTDADTSDEEYLPENAHGRNAGQAGQNRNGQNENDARPDSVLKRCLKFAVVGSVIGLAGYAWYKWSQ